MAKSDIRLPDKSSQTFFFEVAELAHRYQLQRDKYVIDIEVNPTHHGWPINLQILATSKLGAEPLSLESSWQGNCGITGRTSKKGSWDSKTDQFESVGYPFFTDPKAVGFLWYSGTGYCKADMPQTAEHASKFPIIIKVYSGVTLIGEEQIDFEIFKNGLEYYIVTP